MLELLEWAIVKCDLTVVVRSFPCKKSEQKEPGMNHGKLLKLTMTDSYLGFVLELPGQNDTDYKQNSKWTLWMIQSYNNKKLKYELLIQSNSRSWTLNIVTSEMSLWHTSLHSISHISYYILLYILVVLYYCTSHVISVSLDKLQVKDIHPKWVKFIMFCLWHHQFIAREWY